MIAHLTRIISLSGLTTIAALAAVSLSATPLRAQKTDVVTLRNGKSIIGEIKKLQRGKLEYSTDEMGTVYIEWDKVVSLTSRWFFEVELQSGRLLYGNLPAPADTGTLVVSLIVDDTVSLDRVVRITLIEDRFWQRVHVKANLGFNLTKADNQQEYSVYGEVRYRGTKYEGSFSIDTYFRTSTESETFRNQLTLGAAHTIARKWRLGAAASAQQNQELDLDLRTQIGVGPIRNFIRSNSVTFDGIAAILVGQEKYAQEASARFTAELSLGVDFEAFRYDDPELDFTSTFAFVPSLSDLGRVRLNLDTNLSYEVINNFTLGLKGFVYIDTRPPVEVAANSDYALNLTLGWKYN